MALFGVFSALACGEASKSDSGTGDKRGLPTTGGAPETGLAGQSSSGGRGIATTGGRARGGASGAGADAGGNTAGSPSGAGAARGGSDGGTAPVTGGSAGSNVGGSAGLPPANAEEEKILAPLSAEDSAIQAASGVALVELARGIGLARGYAMCRCAISPSGPPTELDLLLGCASDEFGSLRPLSSENGARCIAEDMASVPGFEEHLRCLAVASKANGRDWLGSCVSGQAPSTSGIPCIEPKGAEVFIYACQMAAYCKDGTRNEGQPCDGISDCTDLSDETDCP